MWTGGGHPPACSKCGKQCESQNNQPWEKEFEEKFPVLGSCAACNEPDCPENVRTKAETRSFIRSLLASQDKASREEIEEAVDKIYFENTGGPGDGDPHPESYEAGFIKALLLVKDVLKLPPHQPKE